MRKPFVKNLGSWCAPLADFEVPDTIQPGEYSMGGGMDGGTHKTSRRLRSQRELDRRQPEVERQRLEAR